MKRTYLKKLGRCLLPIAALFISASSASAEEVLLVSENFQKWNNQSASSTASTIDATTMVTTEDFTYTIANITVNNSAFPDKSDTGGVTSEGFLRMEKSANALIELSPLASINRIEFVVSTTGSNRGAQVWKKSETDSDWVSIYDKIVTTQSGERITLYINADKTDEKKVAIKFTNLTSNQYAFISDIKIWGDAGNIAIPPVLESVSPEENSYIPNSGSIIVRFSESVSYNEGEIKIGDIVIPQSSVSVNGKEVTISYKDLISNQNYTLNIPAGTFKNEASTPTASDINLSFKSPDTVIPTIVDITYGDGSDIAEGGIITILFSETINLGDANATLGNKSISPAVVSGKNMATLSYSGLGYGENYTLTIPKETFKDNGGNYIDQDYVYTYTTESDTKGGAIIEFKNPELTDENFSSAGIKTVELGGISTIFDINSGAASRNNGGYTSAIKCNSVTFGEISSVGKLQFHIQNGNGSDIKTFKIEKKTGDTWVELEKFILAGNGAQTFTSVNAKSSDPVELRLTGETTFWLYQISIDSYKDNSPIDDGLPPVLQSSNPENNASIAINGTIKLTFNKTVTAGSGIIDLNGKTLNPNFVGTNVTLPYSNLKYETDYTLTIPAGAIQDKFGNLSEKITLTFKTKEAPATTPKMFDAIVDPAASTGNGVYQDIQDAFDAVPANNAAPFLIFVKNGTYNYADGRLILASGKNKVSLIGESREGVIITGDNYVGKPESGSPGTSETAVFDVIANEFYGENFTVINTGGVAQKERAVGIRTRGDKVAFKNVSIKGGQDILYTHTESGKQYYKNCSFNGTIDYIFGGGDILFDECELFNEKRMGSGGNCVITAPSTLASLSWGYVFTNCTINGDSSQDGIYQLGRPWQGAPRSVWINTTMNILPSASGWADMDVLPALFAEYNSLNGNGSPVDLSSRKTDYYDGSIFLGTNPKTSLTEEEAAIYTPENIFGTWNALAPTEATAAPSNLALNNNILTWDAVAGAISYVIFYDDKTTYFTTEATYNAIEFATAKQVEIAAVATSGALSERTALYGSSIGNSEVPQNAMSFIASNVVESEIIFTESSKIASIQLYAINGMLLKSVKGEISNLNISDLAKGTYLLCITTKENQVQRGKIVKK